MFGMLLPCAICCHITALHLRNRSNLSLRAQPSRESLIEVNGVPGPSLSSSDVELNGSSGQSATQPTKSADFTAQRRWPRYCVGMTVQVRVTTQGPTRVVTWKGHGTDISCGGLAVTVDSNLPLGSQVGVEFTLPYSDQLMTFRCFVRNRDGNRYGVEFITENDEDYRHAAELQAELAAMKTS